MAQWLQTFQRRPIWVPGAGHILWLGAQPVSLHELFRGLGHGHRWGRRRDVVARAQDTCSDAHVDRIRITARTRAGAGEADD